MLDTSVVLATDVGPLEDDLAISAVTFAELHFGVLVAREPHVRAERLRRLLVIQRVRCFPLDDPVAGSYGAGRGRCRSWPTTTSPVYGPLIAATAHAH